MQNEKAARAERDRTIAFEAAEAALIDAELDIDQSPDATRSRSTLFSSDSAAGFPGDDEPVCQAGSGNRLLGLCRHAPVEAAPAWLAVDFMNAESTTVQSVPYGAFTGRHFQVAAGPLPRRVPRYVIELMHDSHPSERADHARYFYRITAVGFGVRESTQVVLQSVYRKAV